MTQRQLHYFTLFDINTLGSLNTLLHSPRLQVSLGCLFLQKNKPYLDAEQSAVCLILAGNKGKRHPTS